MKKLIVRYREMFQLLKLDLPNLKIWLIELELHASKSLDMRFTIPKP